MFHDASFYVAPYLVPCVRDRQVPAQVGLAHLARSVGHHHTLH
jgi:hypothetical protein